MPVNEHYIVIGNGAAGNRAAVTLRKNDPDSRITILSDESIHAYCKNRLMPFISGNIQASKLMMQPVADYSALKIRLRLGQCVERIDFMERVLFLKHMEKVNYTKLILASGSRPGIPTSLSEFSEHLNTLAGYNDVVRLKESILKADHFFVIGGDLVAFQFMKLLKDLKKKASFMLTPESFWPFSLQPETVKAIEKRFSAQGVEIITDDALETVKPNEAGFLVKTGKGIEKQVDMIFAFCGLIPNIKFAMGRGIDIDRGILVDEYLKTNLDGVYACGSCAQIYNPEFKSYATSVGWANAVIQGEVAAKNLLGASEAVSPAPQKLFDLEGAGIMTAWWDEIDEPTGLV